MRVSVLAVIVLYKIEPAQSVTVQTLARALQRIAPEELRIKVLLADNSLQPQTPPGIFADEVYRWFPGNPGLAHAYNTGIETASHEGYDWLLTLDQDTSLPVEFAREMLDAVRGGASDAAVGSVVPHLMSGDRIISPYWFRAGAVPIWYPRKYAGIAEPRTYALNSGSLLRVNALREAGGYDPRFWLDASDHAIFHALADYGKKVCITPTCVEHGLSVVEQGAISGERYANMLAAESAFWDLRMSRAANLVRNAALLVRSLRRFARAENELALLTIRHLIARVFVSRRSRISAWEQGLGNRGNLKGS